MLNSGPGATRRSTSTRPPSLVIGPYRRPPRPDPTRARRAIDRVLGTYREETLDLHPDDRRQVLRDVLDHLGRLARPVEELAS